MEEKTSTGNTAAEAVESPTKGAKKTTKTKAKAQREKVSHPPTSEMVNTAIKELKDRKGSSLQAIKKYIASTYKVDGEKFSPFIKKYLKSAVTSGAIVQTKGKGASGSFKLSTEKSSESSKAKKVLRPAKKSTSKKTQSVEKKAASKKTTLAKKPPSPKKAASEKKPAASKSVAKVAVVKTKTATEGRNISKTKKTSKAPAAKTRTPKPKKVASSRAAKSAPKK